MVKRVLEREARKKIFVRLPDRSGTKFLLKSA